MDDPGASHRDGCREFRLQKLSRREALYAGTLAMAGLGLPELYRNRAVAAGPAGFGRARSCCATGGRRSQQGLLRLWRASHCDGSPSGRGCPRIEPDGSMDRVEVRAWELREPQDGRVLQLSNCNGWIPCTQQRLLMGLQRTYVNWEAQRVD